MILLLNGTSSAGKSALAAALLDALPTPWFHLGVDDVGARRGARRTAELGSAEVDDVLRRTRAGYHRAVAGLADAGNDVVMDHVLSEPWRLDDLLDVLAGHEVVLIGVHCDPDELDRRERERGDRTVGAARAQLAAVHAHGEYDVEVDTTHTDPGACAAQVVGALAGLERPLAFERLRRARTGVSPPGLEPHPEGGWYRRTWASPVTVTLPDGRVRPTATLIWFLLPAGEHSAWHRVASDELWLAHDGRVVLELGGEGEAPEPGERVVLDADDRSDADAAQALVPAGTWQCTVPTDADALVRCLVSPGFDFDDFELA